MLLSGLTLVPSIIGVEWHHMTWQRRTISARPGTRHIINTRGEPSFLLSYVASSDVASNVCRALPRRDEPRRGGGGSARVDEAVRVLVFRGVAAQVEIESNV